MPQDVRSQIILSTILRVQNNNHTQEHKYLREKLFLFEGKKPRDKLRIILLLSNQLQ